MHEYIHTQMHECIHMCIHINKHKHTGNELISRIYNKLLQCTDKMTSSTRNLLGDDVLEVCFDFSLSSVQAALACFPHPAPPLLGGCWPL